MTPSRVRDVSIAKVVVARGRRPLGDVSDLARSIAEVGLLHPIVVTSQMRLVAGLHRLHACKQLGWAKIPATVLPLKQLHAGLAELDENLARNELSVLERAEQLARRKRLYEAIYPQTKRGVAGGTSSGASRRGDVAGTTVKLSLVRQTASKQRVSPRTIERLIQIADAIPRDLRRQLAGTWAENHRRALLQIARLPSSEQRAVVNGIVNGVTTVRTAKANVIAKMLTKKIKKPTGRYHVIVVDPPWPYLSQTEDYPSASFAKINALPIAELAEDNCIVWLWTTNLMMRHAYACLDAWGFAEQTILTWVKPGIGKGWYLRNQTEHCVVAIRGRPVLTLTGQSTALHAKGREPGRKPDEFYALVESLCVGSKLDMFARQSRNGWTTWGAERTKFDRVKAA